MSEVGFDELFVVEYPRLVALGVAMSGDREVARDLAQETMLRAHRRWDDVRAYDRPSAWLRRVMANLLIDHHRACTSERTAVGRLGRTVLDSAPEPPLPSRWDELVAPLTANQRLIATLYYAEDCSIGEIADVVGVSAGTVKSTLAKVRRNLEARLTADELASRPPRQNGGTR